MSFNKKNNKFISESVDLERENLIQHLNKYLLPRYEIVVGDIPEKFLNNPRNVNKSIKYAAITKTNSEFDESYYTDWFYNDLNVSKLLHDAEMMMIIDRDMDPVLSGEFKDIGQKIILALNNIKIK